MSVTPSIQWHIRADELFRVGFFLLLLALVGLTALTPWMGLVGDDWWYFSNSTDGQFPTVLLQEHPERPLGAYFWLALWHSFGLRIWAYYIFNSLIQWLSGLVLFVMLRRIFGLSAVGAVIAAAIFLLYPSDTARVYLSALWARIAMLFAISGAYLWLRTWTMPATSARLHIISLFLMGLALLTYETPLFLLALLPIALALIDWQGKRDWLRKALPCYALLVTFLIFRLTMAHIVSQEGSGLYSSFRLEPYWLVSQFQAVPSAVTLNGWMYAIKLMSDFGLVKSGVLLILVMMLVAFALEWLRSESEEGYLDWRRNLKLIGSGAILSVAAVVPVFVSHFSLEAAVGTLEGRLVHGAAIGHAILMLGLFALPWSLLFPGFSIRNYVGNVTYATLIAIALIGSLGVQREYAQAWRSQLDIVRSMRAQAPAFRDDTVIVLLDVPAGAFDIRFYQPFTQLVRYFYANETLHVIPWQRGFPPRQQVLAFGEETAVVMVDLVNENIKELSYDQMVAFQVELGDELRPISHIGSKYLCQNACGDLPIPLPEGWIPARAPIALNEVDEFRVPDVPINTAWRQMLLESLSFSARFSLP